MSEFNRDGSASTQKLLDRITKLEEALIEIRQGQQPCDYAKPLVTIDRLVAVATEALEKDETLPSTAIVELRRRSGPGSAVPTLPQLSIAAKAARLPLPPDERVGALQDTVHHEVGNSRASRAARIKSELEKL